MAIAETDKRFGKRARALRKFRGLTLEELGEAVGLNLNVVNRIEMGSRKTSVGEAEAISAALGVRLELLVGDYPLLVDVYVDVPDK